MMELITLIKEYIPEKRDLISEEKKDHLEVWLNAEIEGKKYSNDEIANLVMTMIIGGSDTVP